MWSCIRKYYGQFPGGDLVYASIDANAIAELYSRIGSPELFASLSTHARSCRNENRQVAPLLAFPRTSCSCSETETYLRVLHMYIQIPFKLICWICVRLLSFIAVTNYSEL
jgi:hypothetical protein